MLIWSAKDDIFEMKPPLHIVDIFDDLLLVTLPPDPADRNDVAGSSMVEDTYLVSMYYFVMVCEQTLLVGIHVAIDTFLCWTWHWEIEIFLALAAERYRFLHGAVMEDFTDGHNSTVTDTTFWSYLSTKTVIPRVHPDHTVILLDA